MKRCSGDDRRACVADDDCSDVCDLDHDLQCTSDTMCGGDGPCVPTIPCVEHPDVGSFAMWIDEPFVSEAVPLGDCVGQWFSHLSHTAVYRPWTEDILHVTDCAIVPAATYEVRSTTGGEMFSDALTIGTTPKPQLYYGDVVGMASGDPPVFAPPDRINNVVDVQAFLRAAQALEGCPHTTWVDLQSGTLPVVPQQILNVGDLQTIKMGYIGKTYAETPGHENPGDCP